MGLVEAIDPPDDGGDNAEPSQPRIPHLPAPVLAIVLDHLPFDDVRKAIQAAKIFATDVASHVKTLNIMRTRELGYGNYRFITRFHNVTCVKILCLIRVRRNEHYEHSFSLSVNRDSVDLIIPFIGHFTHTIRDAYLGGFDSEGFVSYDCDYSNSHLEDNRLIRSLLIGPNSLDSAFRKNMFPKNINIFGLPYGCHALPIAWTNDPTNGSTCSFCLRICQSFPAQCIKDGLLSGELGYCLSHIDFCDVIRKRFGGNQIQLEGLSLIQKIFGKAEVADFLNRESQDAFIGRIGLPIDPEQLDMVYIRYLHSEQLDTIEHTVSCGFDPSQLRFYDVIRLIRAETESYEDSRKRYDSDPELFILMLKSTYERLVALRFPIGEANPSLIIANDEDPLISEAIEDYERSRTDLA